jgi:hypothetical protein
MEESQRRRINASANLEGETMRFTWLVPNVEVQSERFISTSRQRIIRRIAL